MDAWSALKLPLENTVKSKLILDQKRIENDFPYENEN
jgi:hypothetical protein